MSSCEWMMTKLQRLSDALPWRRDDAAEWIEMRSRVNPTVIYSLLTRVFTAFRRQFVVNIRWGGVAKTAPKSRRRRRQTGWRILKEYFGELLLAFLLLPHKMANCANVELDTQCLNCRVLGGGWLNPPNCFLNHPPTLSNYVLGVSYIHKIYITIFGQAPTVEKLIFHNLNQGGHRALKVLESP